MEKKEIIKGIGIFAIGIIDFFIAIYITKVFNISNIILWKSISYDMTYEVLIWFGLILIEVILYYLFIYFFKKIKKKEAINGNIK